MLTTEKQRLNLLFIREEHEMCILAIPSCLSIVENLCSFNTPLVYLVIDAVEIKSIALILLTLLIFALLRKFQSSILSYVQKK